MEQLAETPLAPCLQVGEARLWVLPVRMSLPGDWDVLDDEERSRARRLRFDADRHAYVLAHALRRRVLAQATGHDAASLRFVHDAHGRPALALPHCQLFFSHAHARAGVAFALANVDVGVDIESSQTIADDFAWLERFIAEPVSTLSDSDDAPTLAWVALEAYWKAQGRGLADGQPRLLLRGSGGSYLHCSAMHEDTAAPHPAYAPADVHVARVHGCVAAMALLRKGCSA